MANFCLHDMSLLLLFVVIPVTVHAQTEMSEAVITFSPPPEGTPPVYTQDKYSRKFPLPIVIKCDGTRNPGDGLVSLYLAIKRGDEVMHEERLDTKTTIKAAATEPGFQGTITSKWLSFTMTKVECSWEEIILECSVAGVPNKALKVVSQPLSLAAASGPVTVFPKSNPRSLNNEGDFLTITCNATVSNFFDRDNTDGHQVEWQWKVKGAGKKEWEDVTAEVAESTHHLPLVPAPCYAANATVRLSLTLKKEDSQRTYRCAYKNTMAGDTEFNILVADTFTVGLVRERKDVVVNEKRKIVYTLSSLVGMILGICSFLIVCCLGLLYTYRKKRRGKKYDIVKGLLKQEEEELDKIEASLGVAAAMRGVSNVHSEMSSLGGEESRIDESSIVESSMAEESNVETSISAAPTSTVG